MSAKETTSSGGHASTDASSLWNQIRWIGKKRFFFYFQARKVKNPMAIAFYLSVVNQYIETVKKRNVITRVFRHFRFGYALFCSISRQLTSLFDWNALINQYAETMDILGNIGRKDADIPESKHAFLFCPKLSKRTPFSILFDDGSPPNKELALVYVHANRKEAPLSRESIQQILHEMGHFVGYRQKSTVKHRAFTELIATSVGLLICRLASNYQTGKKGDSKITAAFLGDTEYTIPFRSLSAHIASAVNLATDDLRQHIDCKQKDICEIFIHDATELEKKTHFANPDKETSRKAGLRNDIFCAKNKYSEIELALMQVALPELADELLSSPEKVAKYAEFIVTRYSDEIKKTQDQMLPASIQEQMCYSLRSALRELRRIIKDDCRPYAFRVIKQLSKGYPVPSHKSFYVKYLRENIELLEEVAADILVLHTLGDDFTAKDYLTSILGAAHKEWRSLGRGVTRLFSNVSFYDILSKSTIRTRIIGVCNALGATGDAFDQAAKQLYRKGSAGKEITNVCYFLRALFELDIQAQKQQNATVKLNVLLNLLNQQQIVTMYAKAIYGDTRYTNEEFVNMAVKIREKYKEIPEPNPDIIASRAKPFRY